jgi:hypothetical protein
MWDRNRLRRGIADAAIVNTGNVVAHSHEEKNPKPEDGACYDKLRAPWTVARMHEVEYYEGGLRGRDGESNDNVPWAEVSQRSSNSKVSAQQQGHEDHYIDFGGNNMLRHKYLAFRQTECRLIR